ncbi:hypothetical protein BDV12DRAFT_197433 [Aspergillus spectabilis]
MVRETRPDCVDRSDRPNPIEPRVVFYPPVFLNHDDDAVRNGRKAANEDRDPANIDAINPSTAAVAVEVYYCPQPCIVHTPIALQAIFGLNSNHHFQKINERRLSDRLRDFCRRQQGVRLVILAVSAGKVRPPSDGRIPGGDCTTSMFGTLIRLN